MFDSAAAALSWLLHALAAGVHPDHFAAAVVVLGVVALVASALAAANTAVRAVDRGIVVRRASAVRELQRALRRACIAQRDPDADGHPRPRAPAPAV